MKQKKILITGGAGFIGSHLVDACLKQGYEVVVLDDFSHGRLENLEAHKNNPRLAIVKVDISQFDLIKHSFNGVNWVFHLASRADANFSLQNPLIYHKVNVEGTAAVLEASRAKGVQRIIYAASSSCYGIPERVPTSELTAILPESPDALTQYQAEQNILHWERIYGIPALSLRIFNVYGPRARSRKTFGEVFQVFLTQKLNHEPFTIAGDGTQSRDFIYVADVVDALMMAAESELSGEVLNVGSGQSTSINTLVKLLGGGATTPIARHANEADKTCADITKIKQLLGWKPSTSLEDGVQKVLTSISDWKYSPLWTREKIEQSLKKPEE